MALNRNTMGLNNGPMPVAGLTGLVDEQPFATAEERSGGPADPRHAVLGERAHPYPWERTQTGPHGPYGQENQFYGPDSMDALVYILPAGVLGEDKQADLTPSSAAQKTGGHAAPWPKGLPQSALPDDENTDWLVQRAGIHASNTGASRGYDYEDSQLAQNDEWQDFYE